MRQTILFLQPRLEVLFNTYLSNPLVESRKLRAQYILGDLILTSSDTYSPDCRSERACTPFIARTGH